MESFTSSAIILRRIEYGEADRIITFLTPQHGQVRAMAKGVRKGKSKLAGGLELLSVAQVTFMKRPSADLHLVRSARMDEHFGDIIKDYDRMQFAYAVIAAFNTVTADTTEEGMFEMLYVALKTTNNLSIDLAVVRVWFYLHMLRAIGQQPNLKTDAAGKALQEEMRYSFDPSRGSFIAGGRAFSADHIKALRLLVKTEPSVSSKVSGLAQKCHELADTLQSMHDRIITLGA